MSINLFSFNLTFDDIINTHIIKPQKLVNNIKKTPNNKAKKNTIVVEEEEKLDNNIKEKIDSIIDTYITIIKKTETNTEIKKIYTDGDINYAPINIKKYLDMSKQLSSAVQHDFETIMRHMIIIFTDSNSNFTYNNDEQKKQYLFVQIRKQIFMDYTTKLDEINKLTNFDNIESYFNVIKNDIKIINESFTFISYICNFFIVQKCPIIDDIKQHFENYLNECYNKLVSLTELEEYKTDIDKINKYIIIRFKDLTNLSSASFERINLVIKMINDINEACNKQLFDNLNFEDILYNVDICINSIKNIQESYNNLTNKHHTQMISYVMTKTYAIILQKI